MPRIPQFLQGSFWLLFSLFVATPNPIAAEELVFDVGWNGPNTSHVEECELQGSCFQYPIVGTVGLILDANRPNLVNRDSTISVPSSNPPDPEGLHAWGFLSYTIGEYLTDPTAEDVSMRFLPNPVIDAPGPQFEFFAELTDERSRFTITGRTEDLTIAPGQINSVEFSVSGRLVPEPGTALLAAVALAIGLSSRRRR
jgi:hypothetical protein